MTVPSKECIIALSEAIGEEFDVQTGEDSNNFCLEDSDSDSDSSDASGLDCISSRLWANDSSSNSSSSNNNSSDEDNHDLDGHDETSCKSESVGKKDMDSLQQDYNEEQWNISLNPDYGWERIKDSQVFLEPPVKIIPPTKASSTTTKDFVRFVFISDTHGNHRDITHLPRGDVLVHAGDFTKSGETGTIEDLSEYFSVQVKCAKFSKVICVAGNHDLTLDPDYYEHNWGRFHETKFDATKAETAIRKDAVYLHDESHFMELSNNSKLHVWGSPYSPKFWDWAFNKDRGAPSREIWDKIPSRDDTESQPVDVLITHGPPLGRGDLVFLGGKRRPGQPDKTTTRAGCYDLLQIIQERVKPRINVFGHIHEDYGVTYDGTTLYVNASTMNQQYEAVHLPIVIDVPLNSDEKAILVQPISMFQNSNIHSLNEWIQWCKKHGHSSVADALASCPDGSVEEWFGNGEERREPPLDRFFDVLNAKLAVSYQRPTRDFRRNLASMVFHLFALSLEDEQANQSEDSATRDFSVLTPEMESDGVGSETSLARWR